MGRRLRVGVTVESLEVPRWVAKVLAELEQASFVELTCFVLSRGGGDTRAARGWAARLWHWFERDDYERNRAEPDAFAPVDVSSTYAHVPAKGFDEPLNADLDVLVSLGGRQPPAKLPPARYGVWSLHHGDEAAHPGSPALFWEMYERHPVSVSTLEVNTQDSSGGRVIYRSAAATDFLSIHASRNPVYWKSAEFIVRRLWDLHDKGWGWIRSLPTYREEAPRTGLRRGAPSLVRIVHFVVRMLATRRLARLRAWLVSEQWFVAYRRRPAGPLDAEPPYSVISTGRGRFFADPFLVTSGGRTYVFFEDFADTVGKGVISYVELTDSGGSVAPKVVLARDYHLAYPHVFEVDGEHYMVPETVGNRTIELYRANRFPDEWVLERTLIKGLNAVDATLWRHDGRWWLFTNVFVEGASPHDELFLFHSDTLAGEWAPHPLNPVISDVRAARPAGRIFVRDGGLIRPSQDCSASYGYEVILNRIEELTPTSYSEVEIERIGPEWIAGNRGTHTYNCDDHFQVLDGRRYRPNHAPLYAAWALGSSMTRRLGGRDYKRVTTITPATSALLALV